MDMKHHNPLPIDVPAAVNRLLGDYEFLESLVRRFADELPQRLADISEKIKQQTPEQLAEVAHSLKGSAANLGATGIADAALRLEELGRYGDISNGETAFDALIKEADRFIEYTDGTDWLKPSSQAG